MGGHDLLSQECSVVRASWQFFERDLHPRKGTFTMQTAKQLSVTLVNKPGRLAAMLTALNKEKVTSGRCR